MPIILLFQIQKTIKFVFFFLFKGDPKNFEINELLKIK